MLMKFHSGSWLFQIQLDGTDSSYLRIRYLHTVITRYAMCLYPRRRASSPMSHWRKRCGKKLCLGTTDISVCYEDAPKSERIIGSALVLVRTLIELTQSWFDFKDIIQQINIMFHSSLFQIKSKWFVKNCLFGDILLFSQFRQETADTFDISTSVLFYYLFLNLFILAKSMVDYK